MQSSILGGLKSIPTVRERYLEAEIVRPNITNLPFPRLLEILVAFAFSLMLRSNMLGYVGFQILGDREGCGK